MPTTTTYPGVYIEELPSGVRTVAGVATSITAFIGRAARGPLDTPVTVNSFADFERVFGGLWLNGAMSFAARDFFLNGGSQALIVRLFRNPASGNASASLTANGLTLTAAAPGAWGNKLRARIDYHTRPLAGGAADNDIFNLSVRDDATGEIEVFRNVSHLSTHLRRADKVLENGSKLVRTTLPGTRPIQHPEPQPGENVWGDNSTATNAKVLVAEQGSDGQDLISDSFIGTGKAAAKTGLYALEKADLFNLLCIPPYLAAGDVDSGVVTAAAAYCEKRRAFLLVDPISTWNDKGDPQVDFAATLGTASQNAALYFPRLRQPNPLRDNQEEDFAPCGAVAGVMARTDAQRGVWKAPAGLDARLVGVPTSSASRSPTARMAS